MSVKETKELFNWIGENWDVITASMPLFGAILVVTVLLVAGAVWFCAKTLYESRIKASKSAVEAADKHRDFAEAKNKELRAENAKMVEEIANLKKVPALSMSERFGLGSDAVQGAIVEIVKSEKITFNYGNPIEELPKADFLKFVLFDRAREMGAARIEQTPVNTTVVSSVSASQIMEFMKAWEAHQKKGKK